jgi:glycosyltransferase involved in cell wall biosynthesis
MSPTHIAFWACNDQFGGSEALWIESARRLASAGVEVSSCVSARFAKAAGEDRIKSLPGQVTVREHSRPLRRWERLLGRGTDTVGPAWIRSRKGLVVISQSTNLDGAYCASLCQKFQIPYVLLAQQAGESNWPCDDALDAVTRAYTHSRASYFVSRGNLDLTQWQIGRDVPRAAVVANPFHVPYHAALDWPSSDAGWKLACVARLHAFDKGIDLLLEIFAKDKWRQRPVTLSLFGEGNHGQALRELRQFHRLHNVTFMGHTTDVQAVWQTHHMLVLPSRQEGLPLALVEAMLCNRGAVVTNISGSGEVIEDGTTGFVAEAPITDCVEEALERAWNARESWRSMGEKAGENIRTIVPEDPPQAFADRLLDLLK